MEKQNKIGCGKKFLWISSIQDYRICGRMEDLKHSNHIILCPICRRVKDSRTQAISEFKDKLVKHIKSVMWCNAHDVGLLEDLIIKINKTAQEMTK